MAGKLTRAGRYMVAIPLTGYTHTPDYELELRLAVGVMPTGLNPSQGDFTEASFGGYSADVFTAGNNSGPILDGDDYYVRLKAAYFSWDCNASPQTVKGWYLIDTYAGTVLAYEEYATPDVLEIGSVHRLFADIRIGQCA